MPKKAAAKSKGHWVVIWRADGYHEDRSWECQTEVFESKKDAFLDVKYVTEWMMNVCKKKIEFRILKVHL